METLKEKIDAARWQAERGTHAKLDNGANNRLLSVLFDEVERHQNGINYNMIANDSQDAAIDVLIDEIADVRKMVSNLAERLAHDEQLKERTTEMMNNEHNNKTTHGSGTDA